MPEWTDVRINEARFKESFDELARIGAVSGGGVNRPALSDADFEARRWFRERAGKAGLRIGTDGAGNLSAVLACGRDGSPALLLGSHLDSVPHGGRFDGALGVAAALEVLLVVKEAGMSADVHLEAIDFTDEEGAHFGLLGSLAFAGRLTSEDLEHPNRGVDAFQSGLERLGVTTAGIVAAGRDPRTVAGYLELHVEQGPVLADADHHIGVVTAIVGIRCYRLKFIGRADHAGTTPMNARLDPVRGVSAFALEALETGARHFEDCRINIGNVTVEPGAFNVVPEAVNAALELRAAEEETLERLEKTVLDIARKRAEQCELGLAIERVETLRPAATAPDVQRAIEEASESLGLRFLRMPSGAGHDAQSLVEMGPAGLIFAPSVDGRSHCPQEFTAWEDCVNGANVLLRTAMKLARQGRGASVFE